MPAVSPADGPVAVTGASGYIGSWIVHDLLEQGYAVRACVRDKTKTSKVEHLLRMGADDALRGSVELFQADLAKPGSYDAAFAGCATFEMVTSCSRRATPTSLTVRHLVTAPGAA